MRPWCRFGTTKLCGWWQPGVKGFKANALNLLELRKVSLD